MNILMIHPHDIYSPVGMTVRITYLANEFTKMGHEVAGISFGESSYQILRKEGKSFLKTINDKAWGLFNEDQKND